MTARDATLLAWSLLAAAFATMSGLGHYKVAGLARLSTTCAALTRATICRGVILCGWMWLGWHLFAR
jgi:hypothetical protein